MLVANSGACAARVDGEPPINVKDYRIVKDYPPFWGVKSTRSGIPARCFENGRLAWVRLMG
jgi:hypothetical protein